MSPKEAVICFLLEEYGERAIPGVNVYGGYIDVGEVRFRIKEDRVLVRPTVIPPSVSALIVITSQKVIEYSDPELFERLVEIVELGRGGFSKLCPLHRMGFK